MSERGGRLGILGGTLDPIHCGHLAAAVAARDAFDLPLVLVLPSGVPPHRPVQPVASSFQRFAMAALAVTGVSNFQASDDELRVAGTSYTADTLERQQARGYRASEIFFITGVDAFAEIETWKRYPQVLDLANFIVVARPGYAISALSARLPSLAGRMRPAGRVEDGDAPRIYLLEAATPDVSSTTVRAKLARGESISGLVPSLVETYIHQHSLYQPASAEASAGKAPHLHGQN